MRLSATRADAGGSRARSRPWQRAVDEENSSSVGPWRVLASLSVRKATQTRSFDMTSILDHSIRNGVVIAAFSATRDAVKAAPEAAQFQFRVHNEWVTG